ncbi:hypothetical protein ACJJIG_17670 [Microbulbifer sp. SSSA007]|uniref:hypothetical protein n=1 Tax=Microbulbifer sp. SSSA007 TaxID=3243379 RepID=UPI0040393B98
MKNKLFTQCLILLCFLAGLTIVMLYQTDGSALAILFEESPKLAVHLVFGIVLFSLICCSLKLRESPSRYQRLFVFVSIAVFLSFAGLSGYVTVLFSIYPCWLAFKYWRAENA